ncbi:substrate-binding domain-containing protein [Reichenbachiella agarivorans]|uniref:Substrate-binding domain-containing protein n=1 Tax=Reichenbachiella agarivorans TaxID=2979464 RepID=A0ABY6CJU8_9BACT|nr:substrate-binding domain-containing protein [Reichenbachiella agarivorans]UXP30791.1 substrate-binding domain-containing protein [Reichenbachiella agarivorans]
MGIIKLLPAVLIILLFSCVSSEKEKAVLKVKGSESMHETFNALKKDFEKFQDKIVIEIDGGGSRTGLMGIKDQQIDIGLSSYEFNLDSVLGTNHGITDHIVAYDGIVIINNDKNPIKQLTNEQITKIYSGEISDWSELGGEPGRILPIIRNENSGTQKYFSEFFGLDTLSHEAVIASENNEIVTKVYEDKRGIGFIGFAYVTMNVNELQLPSVREADTFFISPSFKTIRKGEYPLRRALRIYYQSSGDEKLNTFLTYLESERAQMIIESNGLISNKKHENLSSL